MSSHDAPFSTRGLYLGKFAPLHLGHEYVIQEALRQVDQLSVMIYEAPDLTPVSLSKRADWIRELDSRIDVIECPDGPTDVTYEPEGMSAHEEYVKSRMGDKKITHFFSSEPYGEHMSQALGALDIRVDSDRKKFPISATQVRTDIYKNRKSLSPAVYFDHLVKVVLLGAPSTGKSTLTEALAKEFGTSFMPEYGREYWENHNIDRRLTLEQLVEIAEEHRRRELTSAYEARENFFIDTNAITTHIFSQYYHRQSHPRLVELADDCANRYDLVLLCDDDIPYADTEDRSGEGNRKLFQELTFKELMSRGIDYHVISGSLSERVARVREILKTRRER